MKTSPIPSWKNLISKAQDLDLSSHEIVHISCFVANLSKPALFLALEEDRPTYSQYLEFVSLVERRLKGEPLQYLLSSWTFRSLDLYLDSRVLIPRPETETLVELAISEIKKYSHLKLVKVADLGTGSGAIALSVAKEAENVKVFATDVSLDALEVAKLNSGRVLSQKEQNKISFYSGSWWEAFPGELEHSFDVVISNPPYLSQLDMETIEEQVLDWEPRSALYGGDFGTRDLDTIISNSPRWLSRPGSLLLEIGITQGDHIKELVLKNGFDSAEIIFDLTNRPRFCLARMSS